MKKNNYSTMAAVAVSKSLLKEYQTSYGRTVYLDKDSEFQIKLFNPTTDTIGAEVYINGKSIGAPIIVYPGQIIWLERYLDEARKFKFDTYEVEMNSEEVRAAIQHNGEIMVKFYKEKTPYRMYYGNVQLNNSSYNIPYESYRSISTDPGYCSVETSGLKDIKLDCCYNDAGGTTFTNLNHTVSNISGSISCSNVSDITTSLHSYSEPININLNINDTRGISNTKLNEKPKSNETGRIEKGSASNQKFTETNISLEYWPFETDNIKILPKSQKPVFKNDLEKLYCTECGRKVKTKFKYCPFCGNKL